LDCFDRREHKSSSGRSQDKGHAAEVEAFLVAAAAGSPSIPLDQLANVSDATLAVVESLRTGQSLTLSSYGSGRASES